VGPTRFTRRARISSRLAVESLHLYRCEAERAFSGYKYTISDYLSRLGEDTLEALECDGAWLRAGL